jgi:hypothetical protein
VVVGAPFPNLPEIGVELGRFCKIEPTF